VSDTQHIGDGDLAHLTASERAAHYRELVDRHLALARTTTAPEAQAAHLELAALWTRLAGEADRQAQAPVLAAADEPRGPAVTAAGAEGGPASQA
jgi:hypothetical protein